MSESTYRLELLMSSIDPFFTVLQLYARGIYTKEEMDFLTTSLMSTDEEAVKLAIELIQNKKEDAVLSKVKERH